MNRLAAAAGLALEWDPAKLSCLGTARSFTDALREVLSWLVGDINDDATAGSNATGSNASKEGTDVVVLFMDTKHLPGHAVDAVNQAIVDLVGDWLWTPADGNPMNVTLLEFRERGKKLLIEANGAGWTQGASTAQQVFYPTFWAEYQFSESAMGEFPDCSLDGDRSW